MTTDTLLAEIRRRGGDVRVLGERLQYRPPGVLTDDELRWLLCHQPDVVRALEEPAGADDAVVATVGRDQPFGEAGPGVKAWHCSVTRSSVHVRGQRRDGSAYCTTCHPPNVRSRS